MRAFAAAWPDWPSFQRVVGKIPWGHNLELLDGLKDTDERLWYAEKAYEHGWARSVLAHHIDTKLHLRQGAATTNFSHALPSPDSDLAQQLLKDPYHFEFLGITDEAAEREIESALMTHVQRFLLELGRGFAFVGRQYLLAVGGEDFFIDLLFFHIPTKRYVVIELKRTGFAPEAIGKLNFYVNVIDDQLCNDGDNRTIGLLLCKDRNEVVVRYALSGFSTPLAVAGYRLADLPPEAQAALPQEAGLIEAVDAAVDAFEQEHGED